MRFERKSCQCEKAKKVMALKFTGTDHKVSTPQGRKFFIQVRLERLTAPVGALQQMWPCKVNHQRAFHRFDLAHQPPMLYNEDIRIFFLDERCQVMPLKAVAADFLVLSSSIG